MIFKAGDIGFLMHHDSLLSKVIAWFMKSKWSHSFLVLEQTKEDIYILETTDFEVVISSIKPYLENPRVSMKVYRAEIGEEEASLITKEAKKLLKKIYGYLQMLSLGVRRLLMRVGIKIDNFFKVSVVCCGVPLTGYTKSSILGLQGIDPTSIDTQELEDLLKKTGRFQVVFEKAGS